MTRKLRAEPIGKTIERAQRDESLRLHAEQTEILGLVEGVINELEHAPKVNSHQVLVNVDDLDNLIGWLRELAVLPTVGGRKPKSESNRAYAAEAKAYWREQQALAKQTMSASAANELATRRLGERYPQYKGKDTKTIVDMMQRHDPPD